MISILREGMLGKCEDVGAVIEDEGGRLCLWAVGKLNESLRQTAKAQLFNAVPI
jgi:hypothetical protein